MVFLFLIVACPPKKFSAPPRLAPPLIPLHGDFGETSSIHIVISSLTLSQLGHDKHRERAHLMMSEQEGPADIDMRFTPSRAKALSEAIQSVSERISTAAQGRNVRNSSPSPSPIPSLLAF